MRKQNFIILTLLLLFFTLDALACTGTPPWQKTIITGICGMLEFWLGILTIYFIIRGLISYKNENHKQQNLKLIYGLPALIYFFFFLIIKKTLFSYTFDIYTPLLLCLGYTLYIAFCCTYQLTAYIKKLKHKNWTWINPLVPFYAIFISFPFVKLLKFYNINNFPISLSLLTIITCLTAYSLYKLDKLETPNHLLQKIIWGLLLISACALSSYTLYKYNQYAYLDNC